MMESETTTITLGEAASLLANMVGWKAGEGGPRQGHILRLHKKIDHSTTLPSRS